MGKIYSSTFKTLKNDTISVDIYKAGQTGADGEADTLVLDGTEPVTIEYVQDSVFDTLKLSTCSVRVMTDSPVLDLFTGKLSEVELKVLRNGSLIWYGFMSPNVYSMPYDSKNNMLSLEFVCPLTAMASVGFRRWGDKFFATFQEYIEKALEKVGASVVVSTIEGVPSALANVGCMQRNYIDEVFDEEDGSMTWQDVMSSIARYMNKTMYCEGGKLVLYDALAERTGKDIVTYYGIAGDGDISLGDVYNKVTVIENTNPIDSLLNTAVDDYNNLQSYMYTEDANYDATAKTGISLGFYRVGYEYNGNNYISCRAIFKPKSNWTFFVGHQWGDLPVLGIASTEDIEGTYMSKWGSVGIWLEYNGHAAHIYGAASLVYWGVSYNVNTPPATLDWEKKVCICGGDGTKPTITYNSSISHVFKNGFIVLNLKYAYQNQVGHGIQYSETTNRAWKNVSWFWQTYRYDKWTFMLRIGGNWWNGSGWQQTECTFEAMHTWSGDENILGTEASLDNTVSYEMGLNNSNSGYAIPISGDMFGDVEFKVYKPSSAGSYDLEDPVGTAVACVVDIKELTLIYTSDNSERGILDNSEADADITICNVIDDNNVQEAEDVTFTTNSYNKNQVSYSYVIQEIGDNYVYYIPDTLPEHICIKRMVSYYKTPKMKYEIKLDDNPGKHISPTGNITASFLGKTFTVGSVTYNLIDNSAEVSLHEV